VYLYEKVCICIERQIEREYVCERVCICMREYVSVFTCAFVCVCVCERESDCVGRRRGSDNQISSRTHVSEFLLHRAILSVTAEMTRAPEILKNKAK